MSIFESPTAVQPADEPARDGDAPQRGFDPRSVQIAGIITAAIVVLGLLVSNAARPEAQTRPVLSSKVAPGAAAVEEAENSSPAQPSVAPPTTAAEEPVVDEPVAPESDVPAWRESDTSSDYYADYAEPGDGKREGHPGKGHGRWR